MYELASSTPSFFEAYSFLAYRQYLSVVRHVTKNFSRKLGDTTKTYWYEYPFKTLGPGLGGYHSLGATVCNWTILNLFLLHEKIQFILDAQCNIWQKCVSFMCSTGYVLIFRITCSYTSMCNVWPCMSHPHCSLLFPKYGVLFSRVLVDLFNSCWTNLKCYWFRTVDLTKIKLSYNILLAEVVLPFLFKLVM